MTQSRDIIWDSLRHKGYLWYPAGRPSEYDYTTHNFYYPEGNIVDVVFGLYDLGVRGKYRFKLAETYDDEQDWLMDVDIEQFVQDTLEALI